MGSMGGINRLPVEIYVCVNCDEEFQDDDVRHTWRCPKCSDYIHIHAEGHSDPNNHIAIIRKRASELDEGDYVLMPGQLDGNSYRVLGVTQIKDRLGIGLEGWGQYKVSPDAPINCRNGTW